MYLISRGFFLASGEMKFVGDFFLSELLNLSQKIALQVVLQAFEENLSQAKHWLSGYEEKGVLYHRYLSMTDESRIVAEERIKEAFTVIERLSRKLELAQREEMQPE